MCWLPQPLVADDLRCRIGTRGLFGLRKTRARLCPFPENCNARFSPAAQSPCHRLTLFVCFFCACSDLSGKADNACRRLPGGRQCGSGCSHCRGQARRRLGQPVVVENVGRAGGTVGAARVVAAAPDGYTLLLGSGSEVLTARLTNAAVRYDGVTDLVPIGLIASAPMVLVEPRNCSNAI